jgi:hypothetical protein
MKPYKPGLPLVTEFEDLIDSLPGRIKLAKLNTREVCKVAGIPRPTYYKQLKARSFTAGEVKTLLRTIAKLQRRFKVPVDPEPEPELPTSQEQEPLDLPVWRPEPQSIYLDGPLDFPEVKPFTDDFS